MAKVELQAPIKSISGKVGGQVYSKNRSGYYLKTKIRTPQPKTELQQKNKSQFSRLLYAWQTLTDAQRTLWRAYATQYYGTLTGQNVFLKYNAVNLLAYQRIAPAPPPREPFVYYYVREAVFYANTGDFLANFNTTITQDFNFKLQITNKQSVGVTNYSGKYRFLRFVPGVRGQDFLQFNIDALYKQKFGELINLGDNIGVFTTLYHTTAELIGEDKKKLDITTI